MFAECPGQLEKNTKKGQRIKENHNPRPWDTDNPFSNVSAM